MLTVIYPNSCGLGAFLQSVSEPRPATAATVAAATAAAATTAAATTATAARAGVGMEPGSQQQP
jgi:hypothetical protein